MIVWKKKNDNRKYTGKKMIGGNAYNKCIIKKTF
jgi:hypothetical protein